MKRYAYLDCSQVLVSRLLGMWPYLPGLTPIEISSIYDEQVRRLIWRVVLQSEVLNGRFSVSLKVKTDIPDEQYSATKGSDLTNGRRTESSHTAE